MRTGPSPSISHSIARASSFSNNCAFHCVALTWLNLPLEKIEALYQRYPIYKKIIRNFYEYYDLKGEPTLENFLKVVNGFTHPYDKEVLLGPVLRNVLQNEMMDKGKNANEIAIGKEVADDNLAILTQSMGAHLFVQTKQKYQDIPHQGEYTVDDPLWELRIFHDKVHYNFTYANEGLNRQHNDLYEVDEYNALVPKKNADIKSLLQEAAKITGVKERNEAITRIVQAKYSELKPLASKRKDFYSPLSTSRKMVGFAIDPKPEDTPVLIARTPLSPKKVKYSAKQIEAMYEEKLKKVFPIESWEHQSNEHKIKITSKDVKNRKLLIKKNSDGVQFSGGKNIENEIAKAANAYKEVCEATRQKVVFQITAKDEEQAHAFLVTLQQNHFDISQISSIHCKGVDLKGESLESFTQRLIGQAMQQPGPDFRRQI